MPASPVIRKIVYHRTDTTGEVQQQQQRNLYKKERNKTDTAIRWLPRETNNETLSDF